MLQAKQLSPKVMNHDALALAAHREKLDKRNETYAKKPAKLNSGKGKAKVSPA